MPVVRLEPTTLVFERAKTVHVLDHAATLVGTHMHASPMFNNANNIERRLGLRILLYNKISWGLKEMQFKIYEIKKCFEYKKLFRMN
jgi:hypothetical protein